MSFRQKLEDGFNALFVHNRFFYGILLIVACFVLSAFIEPLFVVAQYLLILLLLLIFVDVMLLFNKHLQLKLVRKGPNVFNLGDTEEIILEVENLYSQSLYIQIADQLPVQFQERSFKVDLKIAGASSEKFKYTIEPKERGLYVFKGADLFVKSKFGFLKRRMVFEEDQEFDCFPSVRQMKEVELMAFSKIQTNEGVKKVRRIGHSYEFEQIKSYVQGDDIRSVNWKATARMNELMVNQYTDEKSQQIYCVIDKSRVMHMPFNGMSLLDYAVNASLAISNVILKKSDKAGLITFSDRVGATLKADRSPLQLKKIHQLLFNEKERDVEANYKLLHRIAQNVIKSRSLIFLFVNFENTKAIDRELAILRKLNHQHLLVVVMFENSELMHLQNQPVERIKDIYTNSIVRGLLNEKKEMVLKLNKLGIQTILTKPEDLSINTLNKYLELKARGSI